MMKWIVILLIGGGIYYLSQNWSSLTSQWNDQFWHSLSGGSSAQSGSNADQGTTSRAKAAPVVEAWGERVYGGLQVYLPFELAPYNPGPSGNLPSSIHVENYAAEANGHKLGIMYVMNSTLRGGLMLGWADRPLLGAADHLQLDVISTNSATTLLHGFRARRSDYVSRSSPRVRVRCVLFERGNQGWLIEYHAPETDPNAEPVFQRIANSAHTP